MKMDFRKPIDNKEIQSLIDSKYNYYGYIPEEKSYLKPWRDFQLIFKGHHDIDALTKELSKLNKYTKFLILHQEKNSFKFTCAIVEDYCTITTEIIDMYNTILSILNCNRDEIEKLSYDKKQDILWKYKNILSFIKKERL